MAIWPSGLPVILHPGRYLLEFESTKSVNIKSNFYHQSKMTLMHNRTEDIAEVFTFEYLEPYNNGSCDSYSNCLQCLSDSLCGWCDISEKCLNKNLNNFQVMSAFTITIINNFKFLI